MQFLHPLAKFGFAKERAEKIVQIFLDSQKIYWPLQEKYKFQGIISSFVLRRIINLQNFSGTSNTKVLLILQVFAYILQVSDDLQS